VLEAAMSLSATMGLLPARAQAQQGMMPTASDAEGPFFVANTPVVSNLNRFGKSGEPMRIVGRVLSAAPPHQAIAGAKLQLWQTDGKGSTTPKPMATTAATRTARSICAARCTPTARGALK
jgi:protocatechuate 3,4-dioxygenase beta subunit